MLRAFRVVGAIAVLLAVTGLGGCKKEPGRRITGWEPKTGPYTGGGTVTFTGSGLSGTQPDVYFGNRKANVMAVIGDDTIKVETPAGEVGKKVDILLTFEDGSNLTIDKAYSYEDVNKGFGVDALVEGKKSVNEEGGGATPGGTAPAPQGGTAPAPQGGTAPAPQGGTAPAPQGGTAPAPQGGTAPAPQGGTAPAPQGGN